MKKLMLLAITALALTANAQEKKETDTGPVWCWLTTCGTSRITTRN